MFNESKPKICFTNNRTKIYQKAYCYSERPTLNTDNLSYNFKYIYFDTVIHS